MRVVEPMTVTDSMVLFHPLPEDDYPLWLPGVTYNTGDLRLYEHHIYKAGEDGLLDVLPTDDSKWTKVRASNYWGLFDYYSGSKTTFNADLTLRLKPNSLYKVMAFLDVSNITGIHIKMTHLDHGVVYDQTFSMIDYGVANWWEYFYTYPELKTDLIVSDLPTYPTAEIEITLFAAQTASIGALLIGKSKILGQAQYDLSGGQVDYSTLADNEFGVWTITERDSVKRRSFPFRSHTARVAQVERYLKSIRTKPTLWIGSDLNPGFMAYGFAMDFEFNSPNSTDTFWTVDIRGLL